MGYLVQVLMPKNELDRLYSDNLDWKNNVMKWIV
jgi:hypothetical protein